MCVTRAIHTHHSLNMYSDEPILYSKIVNFSKNFIQMMQGENKLLGTLLFPVKSFYECLTESVGQSERSWSRDLKA